MTATSIPTMTSQPVFATIHCGRKTMWHSKAIRTSIHPSFCFFLSRQCCTFVCAKLLNCMAIRVAVSTIRPFMGLPKWAETCVSKCDPIARTRIWSWNVYIRVVTTDFKIRMNDSRCNISFVYRLLLLSFWLWSWLSRLWTA